MRTKVTQSVAFDPEVLDTLRQRAEAERLSVSSYLNRLLAEAFELPPLPPDKPGPKPKVISTDKPATRKRGAR